MLNLFLCVKTGLVGRESLPITRLPKASYKALRAGGAHEHILLVADDQEDLLDNREVPLGQTVV